MVLVLARAEEPVCGGARDGPGGAVGDRGVVIVVGGLLGGRRRELGCRMRFL